ncbi:CLYBL [Branchiostoma lanceolatum]|uniref:CLYBL protein n=1 Tax=Branchiostoma lanceolatum TaxID=7740 RepID=A0A8K0EUE5_BRALA|nr:CLYBL [Branchiostoma lanceolatum]
MRMAVLVRLVQRNVLRKVALSHGRWTTAAFISLTLRREQSTGVTPLMRSVLVLKNSPRSLQNFREAQADVYNLDLEDGVPEGEKESALKLYSETLKSGVFRGPHSLYVRVSDPRNSATLQKEVGELCHPDVTGFILPKVTSADEVSRAAEVLTEMERANNMAHGHLKIIPVIECLDGYKNAFDIAKASRRISALAAGKGDFAACFLVPPGSPIAERLGLRVLQAAKAAGVNAIETPSQGDFDNFARIERDANRGKALGFDGMILLHPKLVPFANQLYSPSRREVDWAEHVTAGARVYQPSAQEPRRFIGPPMRPGALQILQRHSQIQALKSSTSQDGNENEGDLHTVTPLQRTGGLTKTTAGGGWTHGMVPVTLDSSWRAAWSSAFLNAKRLNSCNLAAQEIGLPGVQPPFHLLAMLVTGLAISKQKAAGYDLWIYFSLIQRDKKIDVPDANVSEGVKEVAIFIGTLLFAFSCALIKKRLDRPAAMVPAAHPAADTERSDHNYEDCSYDSSHHVMRRADPTAPVLANVRWFKKSSGYDDDSEEPQPPNTTTCAIVHNVPKPLCQDDTPTSGPRPAADAMGSLDSLYDVYDNKDLQNVSTRRVCGVFVASRCVAGSLAPELRDTGFESGVP